MKVINYFPKISSDTNTLVMTLKNAGKSIQEIEKEVIKFVIQALFNEKIESISKGSFKICPEHRTLTTYNFNLIETAILGVGLKIIEYSIEFVGLESTASLSIDMEDYFYNNDVEVTDFRQLVKNNDDSVDYKTEEELISESSGDDCAGGACIL